MTHTFAKRTLERMPPTMLLTARDAFSGCWWSTLCKVSGACLSDQLTVIFLQAEIKMERVAENTKAGLVSVWPVTAHTFLCASSPPGLWRPCQPWDGAGMEPGGGGGQREALAG